MNPEASVALVLQKLKAGDASAAEVLFHQFSGQLIELARKRLGWQFQRKLDPEDIVQSAFISFFRMHEEGDLAFENWDALWGLLSLITIHKCGHRIEHFRAACRDVGREKSSFLHAGDSDAERADWAAVAQDPSPSQVVMLTETLEDLLRPLNERDQHVVKLALQGWTVAEIGREIGRSERTVQRVLERIHAELLEQCEESD